MSGTPRTLRVATLQLGLITLETGVLSAVADEDAGLVSLCNGKGTHPAAKIKRRDYCPECENDDRSTFAKGKIVGDSVVMLTSEDLGTLTVTEAEKKTLPLTVHKAADLTGTFPSGKSYYLAPRGPGAAGNYVLLVTLLTKRPDLALVTEFSFGGAPALYQVLAQGDVLVLRQLARPSAVNEQPEVDGVMNEALLPLAEQFADTLCTEFDPALYRNKRAEAIAAMLENAAPVALAASGDAPAATGGGTDLMAALTAALAAAAPAEAPRKPARKRVAKANAA